MREEKINHAHVVYTLVVFSFLGQGLTAFFPLNFSPWGNGLLNSFVHEQSETPQRTADYYRSRLEQIEKERRIKEAQKTKTKEEWKKLIEDRKKENDYLEYRVNDLKNFDPKYRKAYEQPERIFITYIPVGDPKIAYDEELKKNQQLKEIVADLENELKKRQKENENKISLASRAQPNLKEATVAIAISEKGKLVPIGAGVMVNDRQDDDLVYIFTAGHVVDVLENGGYAIVYNQQGKIKATYPLRKILHTQQTDEERMSLDGRLKDFAVLAFKPRTADKFQTVTLAYKGYRPIYNQKVLGFGCGNDTKSPASFGDKCQISSYYEIQPGFFTLRINPGTAPGDSGGPLFDSQGRLLGIVTNSDFLGARLWSVHVPSENIWRILDGAGLRWVVEKD